jgi:hypothetical protein
VLLSLSGRLGHHRFSGGFDYGPGESHFAAEYAASIAAVLWSKLQGLVEAAAWGASGCQTALKFGCGPADPLVVSAGLRWPAATGLTTALGVGRVFRGDSAAIADGDGTRAWLLFFTFGYTWVVSRTASDGGSAPL